MDTRRPPEFTLELSADRGNVKDVIKGIMHTIFFHRYFTPLSPNTQDVLDITLPYIRSDTELASLIDTRSTALLRALDTPTTHTSPQYNPKTGSAGRATLVIQFLERKRRKGGWFVTKADEETVWENWIIDITLTSARSEPEAARNRHTMEGNLQKAAMQIVEVVNREKGHIPPITTNEANPFPYQILVNPRNDGWGQKLGIF